MESPYFTNQQTGNPRGLTSTGNEREGLSPPRRRKGYEYTAAKVVLGYVKSVLKDGLSMLG